MGHPVLREKARSIDRSQIKSAPLQKLIDDMIETMIEYHGVGSAAPQVHEGLRLFVANLDSAEEGSEEDPRSNPSRYSILKSSRSVRN